MGKYNVYVAEVHYNRVEVDADSEADAIEQAQNAIAGEDEDYLDIEFSHILETRKWKIEEVK